MENLEAKRSYQVGDSDTARVFGSGDLDVLATPRLVAMCEDVCKDLLGQQLSAESTSVGVHIDLKHLKATAVDATVTIAVRLTAQDGRKYTFALQAFENETIVGEGVHTRVVVDRARFLAGLKK